MDWRCKIGLHQWEQERPISVYDGFPSPYDAVYQTPTRTCVRCKGQQQWLPGYGGSEWGCWMRTVYPEGDEG